MSVEQRVEPGIRDAFLSAGASGRRTTYPLLAVVLCQVFYIAVFAGAPLSGAAERMGAAEGSPSGIALGVLGQAATLLAPYVPLWLWLRYYERRSFFASTGFRFGRGTWRGLAAGLGVAWLFALGWIGVSLAAGTVRFAGVGAVPAVEAAATLAIGVGMLLLRIVMIGIEEQLYRGWLLQVIALRWGAVAGVLASSFFFTLWHFFFIGTLLLSSGRSHEPHWVLVLNIFLWSVFAALWTLRSGDLWAATGFHAGVLILPIFLPTVATPETVEEYPGLVVFLIDAPTHYSGGAGFAGLFEGLPATALLALLVAAAGAAVYRSRRSAVPSARPGR
ncbi:CAAX prenyl protease-like protein [Murinocardiopsis flavida]|uniref:CAAX prenyl protease-like protein n=1 Tax=Murinocardiopsis flavida TaxID=645275 RepID=A0A2P8DKS0_9ACTN|nr:CPBP family glutamic-type intramembrane protease [Murinocardiopsis flavida]PSK97825.1 CAAX prenyl protease-like protein [Murinocardiopsis flavida]